MHLANLSGASGSAEADALALGPADASCTLATWGSLAELRAQPAGARARASKSAATVRVRIVVSFIGGRAAATTRSRAIDAFPHRHGKK
jgi:hypothetical protein